MKNKFIIYFVFILLVFGCYIIPYQREIFEYHLIEQEKQIDDITFDIHLTSNSFGKLIRRDGKKEYYRSTGPYWLFISIYNNSLDDFHVLPTRIEVLNNNGLILYSSNFPQNPISYKGEENAISYEFKNIPLEYLDDKMIYVRTELIIQKNEIEEKVYVHSSFKQVIRIEEGVDRGPTV